MDFLGPAPDCLREEPGGMDVEAKGVAHMRKEARVFGSTAWAVAAVSLVLAASIGASLATPRLAYAFDEPRDFPLELTVDVAKKGERVVSVVVPSSVSIVVKTSVVDGRIMGISTSTASIENSRRSFAPIAVSLESVVDEPVKGNKLLDYVEMTLEGQHVVALREGANQGIPLFDAIAPGLSEEMSAALSQKDPQTLIPAGAYAIRSTLLVTPVDQNEEGSL